MRSSKKREREMEETKINKKRMSSFIEVGKGW